MKSLVSSLLFVLTGLSAAQTPSLVFNHVTVIDATGSPPQTDMAVVITGNRITALDTAGKVKIPKGAQVTDATALIRKMKDAGVKFLAGTDSILDFCFPGFSLHDELALLVAAGLTPMEALQAATCNPAKFLNMADSLGTVEKGKLADLILLEANPLDDIRNTKKIAAVVRNGKLFSQAELLKMLAEVEAAARQK